MAGRVIRYQGAIVRDDHILLIRHRERVSGHDYWIIPGGGIQDGESEAQCVQREMKEETCLDVRVERLLFEEHWESEKGYNRAKTYLCVPVGGRARPGFEPEPEAAQLYEIAEIRWFDLRSETEWGAKVTSDAITYRLLKRVQAALGYDERV
jgi:ADP-ribose pyrophosphatase YjhB (NUDIX family)